MTDASPPLTWQRTSRYCRRAGDYAVSLTLGPTADRPAPDTRRYLVWHGPPLAAMPAGYWPDLLGVADTWPEAAAIAQAHHDAGRTGAYL